ncbi:MAG: DUF4406 domain-containing protein [Bacteroidetes bacterium]|nr:DUF4406 domain-containing protein [Bacteroidota bacterium]
MKPTCYISYPMSGITDLNLAFETEACYKLRNLGYWVYQPSKLSQFVDKSISDAQYKHYLGFDLWSLSRVDLMVLAPNWQRSNGCKWEIEFALDHEIPILLYDNMLPFTKDDYQAYLDSISKEARNCEYKKYVFIALCVLLFLQVISWFANIIF